jgi:hypothetical protein
MIQLLELHKEILKNRLKTNLVPHIIYKLTHPFVYMFYAIIL